MTLDKNLREKAVEQHRQRESFSHFKHFFHNDEEESSDKTKTIKHDQIQGKNKIFEESSCFEETRKAKLQNIVRRVRTWNEHPENPLIQYKPGQTNNKNKSFERRLHLSSLLELIVDIYETKSIMDCREKETGQNDGRQASFPEYVVIYTAQKSCGRISGLELTQAIVSATVLYAISNKRVQLFCEICGLLDDYFHPPERDKLIIRVIERVYVVKKNALGSRYDETMSISSLVFYNIGLTHASAKLILRDLISFDSVWNFDYLNLQCRELHVNRKWPDTQVSELLEELGIKEGLNHRKLNVDEFLLCILKTWTARAKKIYQDLNNAVDKDEDEQMNKLYSLVHQDFIPTMAPLTNDEKNFLKELSILYWNSNIPWNDLFHCNKFHFHPQRKDKEMVFYHQEYLHSLPKEETLWNWEDWPWEPDWEWGGLSTTVIPSQIFETFSSPKLYSTFQQLPIVSASASASSSSSSLASVRSSTSSSSVEAEGVPVTIASCTSYQEVENMMENLKIELIQKLKSKQQQVALSKVSLLKIKESASERNTIHDEKDQLNISCQGVNDRFAQRLGQCLLSITLEHDLKTINIKENHIKSRGCISIVESISKKCPSLTCLNLSSNEIGKNGVNSLNKLLQLNSCHLIEINLSNNKLKDQDMTLFFRCIEKNKSLRILHLSKNNIYGDKALINMIKMNKSILNINLSWNQINSLHACQLAMALEDNYMIEIMNLSFNTCRYDGALALLKSLTKHNMMRELNLAFNEIHLQNDLQINSWIKQLEEISLDQLICNGNLIPSHIIQQCIQQCSHIHILDEEYDDKSNFFHAPIN